LIDCKVGPLAGQYGGVSDPAADFERLFRANYEAVCRYAARRVPRDAVQDVVSEAFLTAWRRHDELRGDPLPWLLGVTRRLTANHLRARARREALHVRLSRQRYEPARVEPDGRSRLALALSTLPARDQEALMLTAWDGLEHRVAAKVMGCSSAAFTVRLHRARHKLERALVASEQNTIDITHQARSTS
jgi:RNA polymerase sigma-70 factor (ECF subfamily)